MKKISVTTWIILAGIFLYTASLWQRPLFVPEFSCNAGAIDALVSGTSPAVRDVLNYCIFKYSGMVPFSFRIVPALLALLAAGAIFLAGSFSSRFNAAKGGAIIFLLMPSVFLSGTSALPFIYNGAPVVTGFFLLFMTSESGNWKKALLPGIGAACVLLFSLCLRGGKAHLLLLLAAWGVYALLRAFVPDSSGGKKKLLPLLGTFLPFLPALVLLPCSQPGAHLILPRIQDLKSVAAFIAAGSFPWVIFWPALLRNFRTRFALVICEPFTRAALLLAVLSLAAALFTSAESGFFIPCLAGGAVLLAAGLEMEHGENGFRSSNAVLYLLAGIFFIAAAAIGTWGCLGAYTKVLKPAWKIFGKNDAWVLSAIVPAVAAVWCLTGAGEKISKERKFLSLCAGSAFLLLACHGLVPVKVVEYNAPAHFLQKVVMPRTGTKAVFYGDAAMVTPLKSVFKDVNIKSFSSEEIIPEIRKALHSGERMCVVTLSGSLARKMPFPKTTLRSGKFTAVFYNIDFPEMRGRKP